MSKASPVPSHKPLHFNVPQIKVMLVRAWKSYLVMSRGIGKSSGILAPWLVDNVRMMPRSQGGIVGSTFQQLLVRTLPPAISMWERMGYQREKHFVIGHEPPKTWKTLYDWKGPFVKPLDSKYAIYWFNGAAQVMISQDRIGSSNGLSLAYLGGDEAKLLNKERLDDEVIPTLRGDRNHFGHLPCYRGEMYLTDMPTNAKARWILEKAQEMDPVRIQLILELQLQLNLRYRDRLTAKPDELPKLNKRIKVLEAELNKLRFESIYYAEANVYDNIDVLGDQYVRDMKRTLSDAKFRASILNERLGKIEGGFYGQLDETVHGADWFNYNYLDRFIENPSAQLGAQVDCRQDAGFIGDQPLDIALDYGSDINCLVVGQELPDEYRVLNSFYVLHPMLTEDVVGKFCEYYHHYPTKIVNFLFDHTAVAGSGVTSFTYQAVVTQKLRDRGWQVNENYCGQAPSHDRKYEFWGTLLKEEDPRLPRFRYSRTNCQALEVSMNRAGVYNGTKGFQKDKRVERDKSIAPNEATHLSDAVDTLVFFRLQQRLSPEGLGYLPMSTR